MSTPLIKASFAVGATGIAGASGFGIGKVLNKSPITSIKEKILSSHRDEFSKFLSVVDTYGDGIKGEYDKAEAINKPSQDGKTVTKENLPSGCEKAVDSPFDEKDTSKLDSVLRWCYVNTNSFEAQAAALNKILKGAKHGTTDTQNWTNAGNSYKDFKSDKQGQITDGETNLNKEVAEDGGTALQKGCSDKLNVAMFSNEAKGTFPKFEKFCLKEKGK